VGFLSSDLRCPAKRMYKMEELEKNRSGYYIIVDINNGIISMPIIEEVDVFLRIPVFLLSNLRFLGYA